MYFLAENPMDVVQTVNGTMLRKDVKVCIRHKLVMRYKDVTIDLFSVSGEL